MLLRKLMKNVKRLEDKLKFYSTSKKARIVISDTKEYLISEDSVKQGRMEETDDPRVEYDKLQVMLGVNTARYKLNTNKLQVMLDVNTAS
ncbi:hypothetical protein Tco_0443764 [Tanacetum coccineum]